MDEQEIVGLVIKAMLAHPKVAAAMLLGFALASLVGNLWQAQPKEKREAIKVARPRLAAVLETIASLSPLFVRAYRVVKHGGKPRDSQPPSDPSSPPASSGFAEQRVLSVIAGAALVGVVAVVLSGCAGATPHVQAIPPTIVQREGYGTCAETGGKIEVAQAGVVSLLTSVCWRSLDAGAPTADASAHVEPEPAVIDKSDAGVVE